MSTPKKCPPPSDIFAFMEEMDKARLHQIIASHMQYPKTKNLNEHDAPLVKANYHCDGPSQCDFREVLQAIQDNPELRAYGSQAVLKKIVEDIRDNAEDHMAAHLDGFQIYRCGIDLLRLQRVDDKGKPVSDSRTGFVEWNDTRDALSREIERKRMEFFHDVALHAANPWWRRVYSSVSVFGASSVE
ncbi:hypothetical protein PTSG_04153 [Salpingoeca rosetta]|uniref:Uncharacterized protein n=1 Tax=Salpingoeca rosetta (strain ATCC 50818 / BSB-021) TaxID=946362 RepID=F2U6R5_SALR5|nr:uncharacterized protein PTSG_04153 [Salpingoeca rosetta]EGD83547.1 hypothetical protein PTSG_04153 [Salpingoeca rosetta]|eukprot:XP_004995051.1 hypothetical protein PTSG_04153 [Salpingoeca rosetta]